MCYTSVMIDYTAKSMITVEKDGTQPHDRSAANDGETSLRVTWAVVDLNFSAARALDSSFETTPAVAQLAVD